MGTIGAIGNFETIENMGFIRTMGTMKNGKISRICYCFITQQM